MVDWDSLHNHFPFSKLDSMLPVKDTIKRAKKYGMKALAITDHGVTMGIPEFYQECNKQDIKAILGMEAYLTEDRTVKSRDDMKLLGYEVYHLILYAMTDEGLANLYEIASEGANDGYFDGYERIDLNFIRDNGLGKGICATSACLGGPISSWLMDKVDKKTKAVTRTADPVKANAFAQDLKDTFEQFYIELGCNHMPEQIRVNNELMAIAKARGIPIVISGDTHYLDKSDAKIHEILLCMNTGATLSDPDRFKFPCDEMYLLHPDEVEQYCITYGIPLEAMENTRKIADMCNANPTPKTKTGLLPTYVAPKGFTSEGYLYKLAYDGILNISLKKKIDYAAYAARLAYELEIICMKGYADYFLILWDIINWCRKNNIMTGPGRGSAAGSLVSYSLGLTKLDPMRYGLYFERFLDPDKDAFPDIDTDFEYLRRQEVIEYILSKYGKENVAQIITFGTIKLKSGIRRIMKVLEYTSTEAEDVANCIPEKLPDQSDAEYSKFKDIMADQQKFKDDYGEEKFNVVFKKVQQFWDYMAKYPDVNTALEKLEGCIANYGVHPSGVVITNPGALKRALPTKYFESAPLPVCQFDMEMLDFSKALKLDVLGLKTLSIIDLTCRLAGINKSVLDTEEFDAYPEVYEMLRNGLTKEVFQLSSPGITRMAQDIGIENFEELADALALYRPGPLGAKDEATGLTMVETYIKSKQDGAVVSIHKDIDEILSITKGCLVYQEQLMKVAQQISGYTLGKADSNIRKPVGKKKIKEFPKIRREFVFGSKKMKCPKCGTTKVYNLPDATGIVACEHEVAPGIPCGELLSVGTTIVPGAIARGYSEQFANSLFDMILKFGGYGFNKSHSACYAVIAWQTAWLKWKYPHEFMCAVMTVHSDDIDEITTCIIECKKMGIDVLPPSVNESEVGFSIKNTPNGKAILYGLAAIRGIGIPAAEEVMKFRPYTDFADYMARVHDEKLKRFKPDGTKMNNPLNKRNEPILILAGAFDEMDSNRHKLYNEYYVLRKDKKPPYLDEKKYDRKLKLEYEKEHMGIYVSDHPLKNYPFVRWNEVEDGELMEIGGIIRKVDIKPDRNGNKYATGTLETLEDKRRFILQNKTFTAYEQRLQKDLRVVVVGWKNEEFNNIRVKQIKLVVVNRQHKLEETITVDASMFGGEPIEPESRPQAV